MGLLLIVDKIRKCSGYDGAAGQEETPRRLLWGSSQRHVLQLSNETWMKSTAGRTERSGQSGAAVEQRQTVEQKLIQ